MEKRIVPFVINIGDCGESTVEFAVTEKERKAILNAIDSDEMFCETESLKSLYEKVMAAAEAQIKEDLELTGDDNNVGYADAEYNVDFCDAEEYE